MRRFFTENLKTDQVVLTGDEFHHLKNVSRLEVGKFVELLDGQGHIAKAEISEIGKKSATLKILEQRELPPLPAPHIEIVLAVPRFQKMDLIIQKIVELGATELTPVVSERSFLRTISKDLVAKMPRWRKIAAEACKQSGRAWPLQMSDPQNLSAVIQNRDPAQSLFLYEGQTAQNIKEALEKMTSTPQKVTVFIGAEGGFCPAEVESFESRGFKPVTLGSLVLRVETACITILSVIEYHFGLLR